MMVCPICGCATTVADSRPEADCVNRKRRCLSCNHRFATIELETDMLDALTNAHKATKKAVDVADVLKAVRLLNNFLEGIKNDQD